MNMNVYQKLNQVQVKLNAPKNQYNGFGKYYYRSCEDILEGLKPLLAEVGACVTINDEIVVIGEKAENVSNIFVKATASFIDTDTGEKIEVSALARHSDAKKGMDDAQVTGATSSYARKYALNGLFCIDDNKDVDSEPYQAPSKATASQAKTASQSKPIATAKANTASKPKQITQAQFVEDDEENPF